MGDYGVGQSGRLERWKRPLVAVVVMALVLLAGVVTLLAIIARPDAAGEPEPTLTSTTTAAQPAAKLSGDAGTLDTPLGPVAWVHASTTGVNPLPHPGAVIQTPDGFAGVIYREGPIDRYADWWTTSPDGVTWTVQPFPVSVSEVSEVEVGAAGGRYWLTDGTGLWLSDDAERWAAVDLSTFAPTSPPSTGLLWVSRIVAPPAVTERATVFSWSTHPVLPLAEIFDIASSKFTGGMGAVSCGWYWDPPCEQDAEHVVVGVDAGTGEESVLAWFQVEGEGDTGVVVDLDTGRRLHEFTLAGFSGDELDGIWEPGYATWNAIGVVGPDHGLTVVEPPWSSLGLGSPPPLIVAVQGRFLAYVETSEPYRPMSLDMIEVWESDDGTTWTSHGTVDFGFELPGETHLVQLFERGGEMLVDIQYDLDQTIPSMVRRRSSDGLTWQPISRDPPGLPLPVRNGFIVLDDRLWLSKDGSTWEQLSIAEGFPEWAFLVGDTLIIVYETGGTTDTWALDLEP